MLPGGRGDTPTDYHQGNMALGFTLAGASLLLFLLSSCQ